MKKNDNKAIASKSHGGFSHWWMQRLSSIFIIIFAFFIMKIIFDLSNTDFNGKIAILNKPCNIVIMLIFVTSSLYHGTLGIRVIIEDYVSCSLLRITMLVLTYLIAVTSFVAFFIATLYIVVL